MDGIINMYKPAGMTSNDVVMTLRRRLKPLKVGHAGTLDPDASGVLPICLGKATRVAQYIVDGEKVYIAEMTLGIVTDTQDASGQVIEQRPINVDVDDIYDAAYSFKGKQQQVPPMYSAIKHDGVPLYKLARRGQSIVRTPRDIEIYDISILDIQFPDRVLFKVRCSKGTYIRTLCHDIGQKLGCGAHMSYLLRTQVANFYIKDSVDLDMVEQMYRQGTLGDIITPIDKALAAFDSIYVNREGYERTLNGSSLYKMHVEHVPQDLSIGDIVKIYYNDEFLALGRLSEQDTGKCVKPVRVFV
ncbi:tRNA pseudouridine(55) synthase TruB [Mahella australiensis]|uniref:tRNA pseudouridine synthase B n=1 Tax=Mahella australiensis (strain DSM 15567 / CIP 107919 / 50-1 BON) TaxID=697281 RepID=F4A2Q6_MAHA5|nr:tRNA pseudouridine(55) synthase TruB [Mahella australiensis]AEE96236.1 tRNA pseudouridine synthase B [Mahella australiensis 50-1 BON]